jgi:hypothetical protein
MIEGGYSFRVDMNFYMYTTDNIYDLGKMRGNSYLSGSAHAGVVILDFGNPEFINGNYGTMLYDGDTHLTIPDIRSAVWSFIGGYFEGVGFNYNDPSFLTIIVGTNTSGYEGWITREHGEAWRDMIIQLNSWLSADDLTRIMYVTGGNDIESFSIFPPVYAKAWVDGYSDQNNFKLYNYGNAPCQSDYPPTTPEFQNNVTPGPCDFGWTQDDVFYVSWGPNNNALPFPEIYEEQYHANASQWYRIALLAKFNYGIVMDFNATLSQNARCGQLPPGSCDDINNSPIIAHNQLYVEFRLDPYQYRFTYPLGWITDLMMYYGTPVP